jgi:tetratricopeptide (TPR) repeat protein
MSMDYERSANAVRDRLARFRSSGDRRIIIDPEAAREVAALRESIDWPPFGPPPRGAPLRRELEAVVLAGTVQFIRCQELDRLDRVDSWLEATELFTAVYPLAPAMVPEPMRAMCGALAGDPPDVSHAELHNEAIDMLDAVEVTGDLAELDQAIWLLVSAFISAPEEVDRARHLSVLGTARLDRYWMTGRLADLDNAVAAHRRAVAVDVRDAADGAGHQANLSAALLARYENTGRVPDLDEAVKAARTATAIARRASEQEQPGGTGPDRALAIRRARQTSQSGLAGALLRRYLYGRVQADLDQAIVAGREAVAALLPGDPAGPGLQANLANLVLERFTRLWRLADLTEAMTIAQAAADAADRRDAARAVALSALALAHADHFQYAGNIADLDLAISVGRQAVAAVPDGHPGLAGCLSNLGAALRMRYEATGDTGALDEAITVLRRAVHAAPEHVTAPGHLNNLGNALRSRYEVSSMAAAPAAADPADIRESVTVLTKAVAAAHRDAPDRAGYVANLSSSLIAAAEHDAVPGAVDQAISILDRDLGTVDGDHPLRHTYLAALGHAWLARFDASGEDLALERAIGYIGRATKAVPGEHPRRAEYLARLGNSLRRKAERSVAAAGAMDRAVARDAIAASRSAAQTNTAPVVLRSLAARDWGQVAAGIEDAAEAVNGLSVAVGLLDQVAWRGLQRGDQERNLGRFAALACDAAAWAIRAGQHERAVELLEQGRGILLTQSLDERAREHDLRRASPDLADRLAHLDDQLERLPPASDPLRADDSGRARRRADFAVERDAVLQQIRNLPGLVDFLRPPDFAALQGAAAQGPVVIINVSGYGCDALTVTTSGVHITPLTGLTGADVVAHVLSFMQALGRWPAEREVIAETLAWLWRTIATPLLPVLTGTCAVPAAQRPRIWWCPTGPMAFLPLHAAGHHDPPGDSVLDRFASSYTPTLRMLLRARAHADQTCGGSQPLVVAMPGTPGQAQLRGANVEADDFVNQFSDASQLRDADATVEAVELALRQSPRLAHFACHGIQDITDPSAGLLLLHDGPLRITEIARLRLDAAEFAYLSACQTSTGGIQLSDEAITLATAFRLAGYRHAIGTLWSISDACAPDIARQIYRQLKDPDTGGIDASRVGVALDAAILDIRNLRRTEPWLWASYVHIGP